MSSFLPQYLWTNDGFTLSDHATLRCPFADAHAPSDPAPGGARLLWGEFNNQSADSSDLWFTAFLLSCITTAVPSAVARVWATDEGNCFLEEAAEHLPRWVDSNKYGTVDEIAHNRVWVARGELHMLPIKGPTGFPCPLALRTALAAVRDPSVSTAASAKVQEHILRARMSHYPAAARASAHRARVLLPARCADALTADPTLIAHAANTFVSRTPEDMHAAERHALLPQDDGLLCTLRMRRCHYAALKNTAFSAPRGWAMPPPSAGPVSKRAADLGLKLCFGLEMYAAQLGVTNSAAPSTPDPLQVRLWLL